MVEIAFQMDQMSYAGFGYAAKRNGQWTIKNLAGFCAGVLPQRCTGKCNDEEPIRVWSVCASGNAAPGVESTSTTAYGKWTIDWSPTVYYRVENDQSLIPGPTWADIEPVSFSVE